MFQKNSSLLPDPQSAFEATSQSSAVASPIRQHVTITVGIGAVTIADVVAVARESAAVSTAEESREATRSTRALVDAVAGIQQPIYGVSTGFGALPTTCMESDQRSKLQQALVRLHAAGSGNEVEHEVVHALMLLRLSTMLTGRTGVRLCTAETYAAVLRARITTFIRKYESLGRSGDLAP
jgi:histidine ammonia-lyase